MANFTCDGITTEVPNEVLPIVKGWIEKRDGEIETLKSELKGSFRSISLDGKSYTVPGEEEELEDAMEEKSDRQSAEINKLSGEVEALKVELSKKTDSGTIAEAVKARRILEEQAKPHLDSKFDFNAYTDREVKELLIETKMDGVTKETLAGYSEDKIDGMFAVFASQPITHIDSSKAMLDNLVSPKSTSFSQKRADAEQELANKWKTVNNGGKN